MYNQEDKVIMEALQDNNFSFIETFSDAGDITKVTKELTVLVFKHKKRRNQLQTRERERVDLERAYNIKKRKSYMEHSNAPNEKTKSVLVEIDTEEEEFELARVEQLIKELNRELSAIRIEIDTWKAISYSLRTEMGAF